MATADEKRTRVMFRLVEISRRMTAPVEIFWGDVGLTPTEGVVLTRLVFAFGGVARSGDLVDYPVRSTAALAKVLAGLEADGLIERLRREDDRRGIDVEVTSAGRKVFAAVFERIVSEVAVPTSGAMTAHEVESLDSLLHLLTPPAGDD